MPKLFIIDDSTNHDVLFTKDRFTGLDLSSRPDGFAYGGTAEPFPEDMEIPESEWQARIEEQIQQKITIPDLCDARGLKVKNQARTNYCWGNAPVHCAEVLRVLENQPYVELSPASICAPIKGFRNVGGWGKEALEWIVDKGIVPSGRWPNNAIDRKLYTDENKALALKYRGSEWWELEPRNLKQLVSAILHGFPVAVGYNWWGHEVSATYLRWLDGTVALGIDNSWDVTWGENGRGIIQGRKMLADDAVCCRTMRVAA